MILYYSRVYADVTECVSGQIKKTFDQFSTVEQVEIYWNDKKVFESSTLKGNLRLRFQDVSR
jgi:hypothetical protein